MDSIPISGYTWFVGFNKVIKFGPNRHKNNTGNRILTIARVDSVLGSKSGLTLHKSNTSPM